MLRSNVTTIGCDPEIFLVNEKGSFVSSIGKFGGTKQHPKDIGRGCAIQEDNVAVEFNIPPADNVLSFIESIEYNLNVIEERAKEQKLFLNITASANFPMSQLRSRKAQEFGCDPDYNAWSRAINPRPSATNKTLRSCGGHLHVGTTHNKIQMIRAMDLFIGVPLSLIDPDKTRRELYGKAGAFRPKPYGVEYRTPSNYWVSDRKLMEWVWQATHQAGEFLSDGEVIEDGCSTGDLIQQAINESDKDAAEFLVTNYALTIPERNR